MGVSLFTCVVSSLIFSFGWSENNAVEHVWVLWHLRRKALLLFLTLIQFHWRVCRRTVRYLYTKKRPDEHYPVTGDTSTNSGCTYASSWALKSQLCFNLSRNRSTCRDDLCACLLNDFHASVELYGVFNKTTRQRYWILVDVTLCSLLNGYRLFEGSQSPHLQGQTVQEDSIWCNSSGDLSL